MKGYRKVTKNERKEPGQAFSGTITEDMEGEELSSLIVSHWHMGVGSTVFVDELAHAHEVMGISPDTVADAIKVMNAYRGHDFATDLLSHAFVPEANRQAVCDLLDRIITLCVSI